MRSAASAPDAAPRHASCSTRHPSPHLACHRYLAGPAPPVGSRQIKYQRAVTARLPHFSVASRAGNRVRPTAAQDQRTRIPAAQQCADAVMERTAVASEDSGSAETLQGKDHVEQQRRVGNAPAHRGRVAPTNSGSAVSPALRALRRIVWLMAALHSEHPRTQMTICGAPKAIAILGSLRYTIPRTRGLPSPWRRAPSPG